MNEISKFTIEEIVADVFDLEIRDGAVEIGAMTDEDVVALHRLLSQVIETPGY